MSKRFAMGGPSLSVSLRCNSPFRQLEYLPSRAIKQVASEDAIRRAGIKLAHGVEPLELSSSSVAVAHRTAPTPGEATGTNAATLAWQQKHLRQNYEPLLYEPWILDIDTTIKTVYGAGRVLPPKTWNGVNWPPGPSP